MAGEVARVPARAHPVLESLARARGRIETVWRARARAVVGWGPGPRPATHWGPRGGYGAVAGDGAGMLLLAELGRRLASARGERFLPEIARWLSETLGTRVAFVLADGEGPGRVFAWPGDGPGGGLGATELASLAKGGHADEGSILQQVLDEPRTLHVPVARTGLSLLHPSAAASDVRSLAVVPLTAPGGTEGLLILHSSQPATVGPDLVALAEEVAARVGLVLANGRLRAELAALRDAQ